MSDVRLNTYVCVSGILGQILDTFDAVQKDVRTHSRKRDEAFSSFVEDAESKSSAWEKYCEISVKLGEAMKACAEACSHSTVLPPSTRKSALHHKE